MLRPGVYRAAEPFPEPLETVNCYLLAEGTDAMLIDTASAPGQRREHVRALLSLAGVRPQEVTAILLTHCHHDHAGGIGDLQHLTGAPVLFHKLEQLTLDEARELATGSATLAAWMQEHGAPEPLAFELAGSLRWRAPERIESPQLLSGGEQQAVGSQEWRVLHTAGHSPGHICLHEPKLGLLVTGDHVLPNESPNISVRPGQPADPLGSYLESLVEVRNLRPTLCLPGHGEPFGNLEELVDNQLHHHQLRLQDVRQALAGGMKTGFEVASEIPWVRRSKRLSDLDRRHGFLAFGETLAHLEYLEGTGEVERQGTAPVRWLESV
jgi:glyoxylase-like metal-dependent hydrolase (beta-lactamase superfamily II)